MRYLLLFYFFFAFINCSSAKDSAPEAKDTTLKHVIKFAKPVFNFDSRYSFINHQQVQISGFKLGVEWIEKFRTGIGFYGLSTTLNKELEVIKDPAERLDGRFRFNYLALYGEYVLLSKRKWEVSFPLQFGLGMMSVETKDKRGLPRDSDRKPIALTEPSITAHYKIFPWIGIGAGAGYRYMLSSQNKVEHSFDSPIYYIKAKIFVGEIYKSLSKKKTS
jgi:hypothetical protein